VSSADSQELHAPPDPALDVASRCKEKATGYTRLVPDRTGSDPKPVQRNPAALGRKEEAVPLLLTIPVPQARHDNTAFSAIRKPDMSPLDRSRPVAGPPRPEARLCQNRLSRRFTVWERIRGKWKKCEAIANRRRRAKKRAAKRRPSSPISLFVRFLTPDWSSYLVASGDARCGAPGS